MRLSVSSLALTCLVILAGCASNSSQHVVDQGHRYDFTSAHPPRTLAVCAAQNARSFTGNHTADVAELTRPGHYQAVVQRTRTNFVYTPIIVARTWPAVNGSQMAVFVDSGLGESAEADWIERLRQGCVDFSAPVAPAVPHSAPAGLPPG